MDVQSLLDVGHRVHREHRFVRLREETFRSRTSEDFELFLHAEGLSGRGCSLTSAAGEQEVFGESRRD